MMAAPRRFSAAWFAQQKRQAEARARERPAEIARLAKQTSRTTREREQLARMRAAERATARVELAQARDQERTAQRQRRAQMGSADRAREAAYRRHANRIRNANDNPDEFVDLFNMMTPAL